MEKLIEFRHPRFTSVVLCIATGPVWSNRNSTLLQCRRKILVWNQLVCVFPLVTFYELVDLWTFTLVAFVLLFVFHEFDPCFRSCNPLIESAFI